MSNDNVIEGQFTDKDREDIANLEAGAPAEAVVTYNTVLKVWLELLSNAEKELAEDPITPMWANKICHTYREVNFGDMPEMKERYYSKIIHLRDLVAEEIASDPEVHNVADTVEDLEQNREHYVNVLLEWQFAIATWEAQWDCTDPYAGVELAAIAEVQQVFFGLPGQREGIVAYIESIKFEYTDDERAELQELIEAHRQKLYQAARGEQ